jgi:hypothetical protein
MNDYVIPEAKSSKKISPGEALLMASGDLRQSANRVCWPAQASLEVALSNAFATEGVKLVRAHPYDSSLQHGFIYNQRMGMDVFENIDREAPLVVAEAVWQYSHNILAGLQSHRGPILTVANWSGKWPGLVGVLNLNGCLHKSGVSFSTLWCMDFKDEFFRQSIRQWLHEKTITHDSSHVRDFEPETVARPEVGLGRALACQLQSRKAILGVFDEGCMGMYNAIIEDPLLNPTGVYKERLSQSALVAAMREVPETDAVKVRHWLDQRGVRFLTGPDEESDLTDSQILEQCRMYIAAIHIAADFGCDAIGIQYQQGLKDMTPASDLVEGLLNNADRPPVVDREGALVTNRVWRARHLDPATTLHDVRWGEQYRAEGLDDFIWLFQISGAAPASHLIDGYAGAISERQPPMYFRLGGGTLKGIGRPGELVWSRVFVEAGKLHADIGRATVLQLPHQETDRRWAQVTPQWPIVHAKLHGVTRDQFMARHRANHLNVAYAPNEEMANKALAAKAIMMAEMGIAVHLCGTCLNCLHQ